MNKLQALLLSLLMSAPALAQDNFGVDLSVAGEKKINTRLEVGASVNARFMDDELSSFYTERISVGVGLGYKLINTKKFDLKASGEFEYLRQTKPEDIDYTTRSNGALNKLRLTDERSYNRHRTSLGLGASYKPNKRWTFSLKETVQYNHYASHDAGRLKYEGYTDVADASSYYYSKESGKYYDYNPDLSYSENYAADLWDEEETKTYSPKDRFILRNKLTVKYDIRHSIFSPYVSCDYGCGLNYTANKWKLTAGTELEITKQHRLDVFYRYQTEDDDDDPNGHLIGVGYTIKF